MKLHKQKSSRIPKSTPNLPILKRPTVGHLLQYACIQKNTNLNPNKSMNFEYFKLGIFSIYKTFK